MLEVASVLPLWIMHRFWCHVKGSSSPEVARREETADSYWTSDFAGTLTPDVVFGNPVGHFQHLTGTVSTKSLAVIGSGSF